MKIFEFWVVYGQYYGWFNFRWVLIFVVFAEGPIYEFQYPRISDFLYELRRKILWPWILNPTNVWFLFNPRKLVPTKIKPSTVHHRCTCKWDWTEMLTISFPLRAKTVWNPLRMYTEICRREEGHNSYPLEYRWSAGGLFCQTRNSSILMMSSSEYLFLNQSAPSQKKYVFRAPIPNICIYGYRY